MSLAAMEAALKPRVLETLDQIADAYSMLSEMQDSRISATLNEDSSFSDKAEKNLPKTALRNRAPRERASPAQQPYRSAD